ncbi:MAG: hypothetical protein U5R48_12805 [Gammaproteobacteria bacterium]|nr:hypothetical protein [Gammaproteobacteria bacterium]
MFHALKKVLGGRGLATAVGDEGGFAPDLPSSDAALEAIAEAVEKAGYRAGRRRLPWRSTAPPAEVLPRTAVYDLAGEGQTLDAAGFADYLARLCDRYPILSIEDGMDESDWDGWKLLTERLGDRVQLVGDDLFVTNTRILRQGIDAGVANSILIKFNQIGSLTETLDAIAMAARGRLHRGHLAIAPARPRTPPSPTWPWRPHAGQIKTGSLSRSDRVAKYNQLLRIEEALADEAPYRGRAEFRR